MACNERRSLLCRYVVTYVQKAAFSLGTCPWHFEMGDPFRNPFFSTFQGKWSKARSFYGVSIRYYIHFLMHGDTSLTT